MATRLMYLCEVCLDAGTETKASPVYVLIDTRGAVIDLCDDHRKAILDPVEHLVVNCGRPVEGEAPRKRPGAKKAPAAPTPGPKLTPPTSGGDWPCAGPGCTNRPPFVNHYQLSTHLRDVHNVLLVDLNAAIKRCREPGCGWEGNGSPAGVGVHVTTHGYVNLPTMIYELALSHPDQVEDVLALLWNDQGAEVTAADHGMLV